MIARFLASTSSEEVPAAGPDTPACVAVTAAAGSWAALLAARRAATRASEALRSRSRRASRWSWRSRAALACSSVHASQPVATPVTGTIAMQSTGQGATHRSQPVHSASITVCICFGAPRIASTGHACMHSVQPMHRLSSITAKGRGRSTPLAGLSGINGLPSRTVSRATPSAPPGGHWL